MPAWKWFLLGYLIAAGAYGGWRGADLWSGSGIWIVGLVPVVIAAPMGLWLSRRTRPAYLAVGGIVITLLAGAWIGMCGVGIAAAIAAATGKWPEPVLRIVAGGVAGAIGGGIALFARRPR